MKPHAIQVHNVFPMISPSVVRVAKEHGIPIVMFVHNYRLACLAGTLMRAGKDCRDCLDSESMRAGVRHGCYRGSRGQSALMAVSSIVHATTWRSVDRFVAISDFVRRFLTDQGVPAAKIVLRPNTVPDPGVACEAPGESFLFAARLEREKGIEALLAAWSRADLAPRFRLEIAGSGPLQGVVTRAATEMDGVHYLGSLDRAGISAAYHRSGVVVVPSLWQEPFGRTAIEAMAHGRLVLATRVGGLTEIVDDQVGWLSDPTVAGLAQALRGPPTSGAHGRHGPSSADDGMRRSTFRSGPPPRSCLLRRIA